MRWVIGAVVLLALYSGSGIGDKVTDAATDAIGNAVEDGVETGIDGAGDIVAGAVTGAVSGTAGALTEPRINPLPSPSFGPVEISPIPRSPSELLPHCRLVTFC